MYYYMFVDMYTTDEEISRLQCNFCLINPTDAHYLDVAHYYSFISLSLLCSLEIIVQPYYCPFSAICKDT